MTVPGPAAGAQTTRAGAKWRARPKRPAAATSPPGQAHGRCWRRARPRRPRSARHAATRRPGGQRRVGPADHAQLEHRETAHLLRATAQAAQPAAHCSDGHAQVRADPHAARPTQRRRQAGGLSPPGHRHAGAHTTTAARCAYGGRSGSGPGLAAAVWSRRRAAGSPVPGRGPTGPAGRCRKMGRPAGRPPDRRRRQWHRRTTARQAFQNTMATMPCRHRQDRASPAAPITRICAWHGSCCYAPAGAQIRRVRARRVVTLGS